MNRIAVDIGGTFTDVVLDGGERLESTKVLTTPQAPEIGALAGIEAILSAAGDIGFSDLDSIIHGTTLATNALIERKGARLAFVTTEGFRDVLEMGHERRFDQYDLNIQLPEPLVARDMRFCVEERIDVNGRVLKPLTADAMAQLADRLAGLQLDAVAIGLLHAYANPSHERKLAAFLTDRLGPGVTICVSSEVSPEAREYERFSTVCANAYVRPLMSSYLDRFHTELAARGFAGAFFMMLSGGGITTIEQAKRVPIRLVESGPAGGVALAGRVAGEIGADEMLALDMGGTTAKICYLSDGKPQKTRRFEVGRAWRNQKGSGLPVRIPSVELVEIGAGGGSIARRDSLGRLAVGPDSAGAEPGPAAYSRGGKGATVTDANLLLGKLDPANFAGGAIALDELAAARVVKETVQTPLGFADGAWAAAGVTEIGEEAMANAARVHAIELGRDVTACSLLASGGAAPLHAAQIAEKLGIERIVIPLAAGVGSAVGFLDAPLAYEISRSVLRDLDAVQPGDLTSVIEEMIADIHVVLSPVTAGSDRIETVIEAELRYIGQGHVFTLQLDKAPATRHDLDCLKQRFRRSYEAHCGFAMPAIAVELVALNVASQVTPERQAGADEVANAVRDATAEGTRAVFDARAGQRSAYAVYARESLRAGMRFSGPCLVQEQQTTTVVPRGWDGHCDNAGHLLLTRRRPV